MRRPNNSNGFLFCFIVNLMFNIAWIIPALILLVLHFILHISILWFIILICIWALIIFIWTLILSYASRTGGTIDPPKENKNPYSFKNK